MLRIALIGMVAHGMAAAAASAQGRINCGEAHKSFLEKLERGNLPPERLAAEKRKAQRIYNACLTGDLDNPKALFERLDANRF